MNRKARRLLKGARNRKSNKLGAGAFDTIDAMMGEAVALHQGGKLDEALCRYREIIELYPDHPDALNNGGLIVSQTTVCARFRTVCDLPAKTWPSTWR